MVDYRSRTVTKATSQLRDIIFQLFENDDENDDYSCLEVRPNYAIAKTNHFNYIKLLQIKITHNKLHMELSVLQHFNSTYRIIFPLFHPTIFVVHFPTTLETCTSCDLRVSSPPVDHRQA